MNLEKELKAYEIAHKPVLQEFHLEETVKMSVNTFHDNKEREKLNYIEFFCIQLKVIQKRWWVLQILLLWGMWELLFLTGAATEIQRGMSIAAALFVVLIIPELWKNRESGSMEIEAASFYSLRQIYAVRLIAFGVIDVFLLTIFCVITTATQAIGIIELLKQLVLPMVVATAISFVILGSRNQFGEIAAIIGCLLTGGAWMVLVMNEQIYARITPLVWGSIFTVAVFVLVWSAQNVLHRCNNDWEVNLKWN